MPPIVHEVLRSPGEPLDPATRAFLEPRLGHDFGSIRVHTDASSAEFARDLNARAVTLGLHVYFRAGCYRPETTTGQDLIAHELGHIAGSSPKGPAVPKLQPDSPRDHEAALRNMLESDRFRDVSFWGYLLAHPNSVDVAGGLLVNEMVNGPAPRPRVSTLLRSFIRRHPESRHGIESYMPVATDHLRSKAEEKVKAMWDQYEASAYLDAFIQWATKRLQEERQHHPRARGQSVPTPLEAQYQMWLRDATDRLRSAPSYSNALSSAKSAVHNMMEAVGPVSYVQEDVLNAMSDYMQGRLGKARRERLQSYEYLQDVLYKPSQHVLQTLGRATERQTTASQALTKAQHERELLEAVPKNETPGQRTTRLSKLRSAKQVERAAAESQRAAQAYTTGVMGDPEVRRHIEWATRQQQRPTEQLLEVERRKRDQRLSGLLPTTSLLGVDLNVVLDDTQRWWIYHKALMNIEGGFSGFSEEHTIAVVLDQRSRIAQDRKATGVAGDVSIGTYHGHGLGQYDIMAAAGTPIFSVQPDTVDLSRVLGPHPSVGRRRIFTREQSHVRAISEIRPDSADADVLAKLVWGFFGRNWNGQQITDFLEGRGGRLPARAPISSRLLGALLFNQTLAGSSITAPIEKERVRIRGEMEDAIRADLVAHDVSVDASAPILHTVDASSGEFGTVSMVDTSAFASLINPRTHKAFTRGEISELVMNAANRVILTNQSIISDVEDLLRTLRAGGAARDLTGPMVQMVHLYNENVSGERVWIVVTYLHLRELAPGLTTTEPIEEGKLLAYVGSSSNAISPHVHMSIEVFTHDPGHSTRSNPIGFLEPPDFFPMMQRGKRVTPKKGADQPPDK